MYGQHVSYWNAFFLLNNMEQKFFLLAEIISKYYYYYLHVNACEDAFVSVERYI